MKPEFGSRQTAQTREELAELVARAVQGDLGAFEQLYRSQAGRVYGLCLRMLADPDAADECTQTTFIKAWENLARFEQRASFSTWLHRIAVNEVLGRQRKAGRMRRHLEPVEDPDLFEAGGIEDPGAQMDLDEAIGKLPEGARNVMVLHEIHGYSHQEIGDMLGVAEGTCKAQLHRARRLLRQRLV